MSIEREKIKKRIVALLNKTVDSGATQAEALSAMEKAGELMAHYDITENELVFKNYTMVRVEHLPVKYGRRNITDYTSVGVARLCQVRVWRDNKTGRRVFFGTSSDTEIASYMIRVIERAMLREMEEFSNSETFAELKDRGQHGKTILNSFVDAMDGRLQQRLFELAEKRRQTVETQTGRDLVILKDAQIEKELAEHGVRLYTRRLSRTIGSHAARSEGNAAGNRIDLNGAVGNNQNAGLLQ